MPRPVARQGSRLAAWAVAAWAVLFSGCAASPPPAPVSASAGPLPRVALLPLENLSGRPECGDLLTRICEAALARTGKCQTVEPGDIQGAMAEARVRTTGLLTSEQAVQLAGRLRARYLLAGTILECGRVRTPEGAIMGVNYATNDSTVQEDHTGADVPLFASGPGAEAIPASLRQAEIFTLLVNHLRLEAPAACTQ